MSDDWNEAQGRINDAGANFEHLAHNQPPTMEGYALLALVDVVRQVGIEMLVVDTTLYSMEETAEELSEPETLYVGGEGVTQRYGRPLPEDLAEAIDRGVADGTIFADNHREGESLPVTDLPVGRIFHPRDHTIQPGPGGSSTEGRVSDHTTIGGPKPADGWFEPPEHWCPKAKAVIDGFKSECKEDHS